MLTRALRGCVYILHPLSVKAGGQLAPAARRLRAVSKGKDLTFAAAASSATAAATAPATTHTNIAAPALSPPFVVASVNAGVNDSDRRTGQSEAPSQSCEGPAFLNVK